MIKDCAKYGIAWLLWPLLWGLWGCGEQQAEQLFAQAEAKATAADSASLVQAAEYFTSFLKQYPQHDLCPKALDRLAHISQQREDMEGAIAHYEQLLQSYPKSEYCDEAQFMIGFICEEYLGDLERAKAAYQKVIDTYPESELAASAQHLLPNVGRAPEEWVKFQDRPRAQ